MVECLSWNLRKQVNELSVVISRTVRLEKLMKKGSPDV